MLVGGHDVDDALGDTGALSKLAKGEGRVGRLGTGLDDDGAAGSQSGTDLAGDHGNGEVPGGNDANDADGLLDRDEALVGDMGGDDGTVGADRLLGEPLKEAVTVGNLTLGLSEGLAVLHG